jgi:hypothetical protein
MLNWHKKVNRSFCQADAGEQGLHAFRSFFGKVQAVNEPSDHVTQ